MLQHNTTSAAIPNCVNQTNRFDKTGRSSCGTRRGQMLGSIFNQQRSGCRLLAAFVCAWLFATNAAAQTTAFTYQGRLTDGGTSANGNYDLQFALWDSASGGSQIGSTQLISTVAVSGGVFAVTLDFGANAFPGANRFLEISARVSGASALILLMPSQQITTTPSAVGDG